MKSVAWTIGARSPRSGKVVALVQLSDAVGLELRNRIAQLVANSVRMPVTIQGGAVKANPSRGARWVMFDPTGYVGELFGFTRPVAEKIARAIANVIGLPVRLFDERGPAHNPKPTPARGQVWRGPSLERGRVVVTAGRRVQVTNLETGGRDWIDLDEFLATWAPVRSHAMRTNPSAAFKARLVHIMRRLYGLEPVEYMDTVRVDETATPEEWAERYAEKYGLERINPRGAPRVYTVVRSGRTWKIAATSKKDALETVRAILYERRHPGHVVNQPGRVIDVDGQGYAPHGSPAPNPHHGPRERWQLGLFRLNNGAWVLGKEDADEPRNPASWIVRSQAERARTKQLTDGDFQVYKPRPGTAGPYYLRYVGPRVNPRRRELSVPDKHRLAIARRTLQLNDAFARIVGGMTKDEARAVILELTGRPAKENPAPPSPFTKGQRVQLHPATDEWMQGDRYGVVVGFGRTRDYVDTFTKQIVKGRPVRVKLDKSGRVRRFHPDNVTPIDNPRRRSGFQPGSAEYLGVLLLGKLGFGRLARDVEQGTTTLADALRFVSTTGLAPESRRIIARAALTALERGHGSKAELEETKRAALEAARKGNPRVTADGANTRVTMSKAVVAVFKSHWPASGLPDRAISFVFAPNGDLVDMPGLTDAQRDRADGSGALAALAQDAQRAIGQLTLRQWSEEVAGIDMRRDKRGLYWVPDTFTNRDVRAGLWNLRDYLVSSVSGGTIWLAKRNPAVRGKARHNPRESEIARARRTAAMWNQNPPGRVRKLRAPERVPRALAGLGALRSVVYESDKYAGSPDNPRGKRQLYEHKFSRPLPELASDGKSLFIVGGNAKVTADGIVN